MTRQQILRSILLLGLLVAIQASFEINEDRFVLDGKHLQIISGSIHYYRIPHQYWKDRLVRLKRMGLNTVQFYTPWNAHEPRHGSFDFTHDLDVVKFVEVIKEVGLHAIVRPGPYICAEWDAGGIPWWLGSTKVSGGGSMTLRSNDSDYLHHVSAWWDVLLPKLAPFMHSQGGPILMAQIENEYGFCGDNKDYLRRLLAIAKDKLGPSALIFTTDPPWIVQKGSLAGDELYTVVDFGPQVAAEAAFGIQKSMNPPGKTAPFCSEFYTGWLTHWGQAMANTSAEEMTHSFTKILKYANGTGSVNLYMAHGGTNFGFWAGAGLNGQIYQPQITSYDYGAPLSEQGRKGQPGLGGPNKYEMLQKAISKHTGRKKEKWPEEVPTASYGSISFGSSTNLLDAVEYLYPGEGISSDTPLNMEEYDQGHGSILYVTKLEAGDLQNGGSLDFGGPVHDFAHVFLDRELVGESERSQPEVLKLPSKNSTDDMYLHVLVHAMGRDSGGCQFDLKGLVAPVSLNGRELKGWKTFPLPLTNLDVIIWDQAPARSKGLPTIFRGEIKIDTDKDNRTGYLPDTFLDLTAWGKGVAFVNGINLGWYWPSIGPENHYYVPGPWLKPGANEVILIEHEAVPDERQASFVKEPNLRGPPGGPPHVIM